MQAQHQSSSEPKAITSPVEGTQEARHLMAIRIVGTAIFDYQVHKTTDTRIRLESLASMAQAQGDLTDVDVRVIARILTANSIQQLLGRNHV
jgi:hypothetical protein